MKTTINRILSLALLLAAFNSQVVSQNGKDSLQYYLETAARNNPGVMRYYYEYQASLEKIPQAGSLQDPELSLGLFLSPMELVSGNQYADIKLMQMFPWFGTLKAAKDEMSQMANMKFEAFREAKLQIQFDLNKKWAEAYVIRQDIDILNQNIELLNAIEKLALARFSANSSTGSQPAGMNRAVAPDMAAPVRNAGTSMQGMETAGQGNSMPSQPMSGGMPGQVTGGLAEVYRIRIEKAELVNSLEILRQQAKDISAAINLYLGRSAGSPISYPDSLVVSDPVGVVSLKDDSTLLTHPMLSMLQSEQAALEARQEMSRRMGYPMAGIGLNYSLIGRSEMSVSPMNGQDMIMPMVSVTLPVFRTKYRAMQKEADLLKSASQQNYLNTLNALKVEKDEARRLYQDAKRRMDYFDSQSGLIRQTYSLTLKNYTVSGIDLTDLLQIRRQLYENESGRAKALADLFTAVAWLNKLSARNEIN